MSDADRIGSGASSRNAGLVPGGLKVASDGVAEREIAGAAGASFRPHRGHHRPRRNRMRLPARDALAKITGMPASMLPRGRQREALGSDFYHGGILLAATGSLRFAEGRETKARSW
jgi:hypothetical protein